MTFDLVVRWMSCHGKSKPLSNLDTIQCRTNSITEVGFCSVLSWHSERVQTFISLTRQKVPSSPSHRYAFMDTLTNCHRWKWFYFHFLTAQFFLVTIGWIAVKSAADICIPSQNSIADSKQTLERQMSTSQCREMIKQRFSKIFHPLGNMNVCTITSMQPAFKWGLLWGVTCGFLSMVALSVFDHRDSEWDLPSY